MANLDNAQFRLIETDNDFLVVDQDEVYWCRLDKRKDDARERCELVYEGLIVRQHAHLKWITKPKWEYAGDQS